MQFVGPTPQTSFSGQFQAECSVLRHPAIRPALKAAASLPSASSANRNLLLRLLLGNRARHSIRRLLAGSAPLLSREAVGTNRLGPI